MATIPVPARFADVMRPPRGSRLLHTALLLAVMVFTAGAIPQKAVVRAVLFFSPSCPHCHDVMDNHLPPLLAKHGDALQIVAVNVETPDGQALYQRVVQHFVLPRDRLGVPALVVGNRVLVGSGEIPAELPGIIEGGIAAGGIGWPAVDAVHAFLRANGLLEADPAEPPGADTSADAGESRPQPAAAAAVAPVPPPRPGAAGVDEPVAAPVVDSAAAGTAAAEPAGLVVVEAQGPDAAATTTWQRFTRDPIGNAISVLVLLVMVVVAAVATRAVVLRRGSYATLPRWTVPLLTLVGFGVAAYMSFVEVTHAEAVCGPVGDCNAVQSSPYAAILGIPVGILGLMGYAALGAGWYWVGRGGKWSGRGAVLLWSAALAGVFFSIYLTFLEPFVIGATCVWCLSSALVMTLILMGLTPAAVAAVRGPVMEAAQS